MRAAQIRKARGLSQDELADIVGVGQGTISRLEKGADGVTLRLLRQVAEALQVDVAELLGTERTAAEEKLVLAYRTLPPERQQGWSDLAQAFLQNQQ